VRVFAQCGELFFEASGKPASLRQDALDEGPLGERLDGEAHVLYRAQGDPFLDLDMGDTQLEGDEGML
jgi:hypothetical protein